MTTIPLSICYLIHLWLNHTWTGAIFENFIKKFEIKIKNKPDSEIVGTLDLYNKTISRPTQSRESIPSNSNTKILFYFTYDTPCVQLFMNRNYFSRTINDGVIMFTNSRITHVYCLISLIDCVERKVIRRYPECLTKTVK
jgi:hypothetical protein